MPGVSIQLTPGMFSEIFPFRRRKVDEGGGFDSVNHIE
jgi:hypothetical protein